MNNIMVQIQQKSKAITEATSQEEKEILEDELAELEEELEASNEGHDRYDDEDDNYR